MFNRQYKTIDDIIDASEHFADESFAVFSNFKETCEVQLPEERDVDDPENTPGNNAAYDIQTEIFNSLCDYYGVIETKDEATGKYDRTQLKRTENPVEEYKVFYVKRTVLEIYTILIFHRFSVPQGIFEKLEEVLFGKTAEA